MLWLAVVVAIFAAACGGDDDADDDADPDGDPDGDDTDDADAYFPPDQRGLTRWGSRRSTS
jgi:hypothetical protein